MKQEIKKVLKKVSPILEITAYKKLFNFHPVLLPGWVLLFSLLPFSSGNAQNQVIQGLNGGFYAECADGRVLFDRRGSESFIPASTLKLVTAAAAIKNLGEEYRFKTEFFLSSSGDLIIRGYGDPTLISEEVGKISAELASLRGNFKDIVVDGTEFEAELRVDGRSRSLNPYDARNGAVVVNFNTVALEKLANGKIRSGETQTPLTPTAKSLGIKLPVGNHRVSIDDDSTASLLYAGELFRELLIQNRTNISGSVRIGTVSSQDKLLLTHRSTKPLKIVLRDVLEYSSNFGANQLLLVMGQERFGGRATVEKGLRVVQEFGQKDLRLRSLKLAEGSGLSRNNRISPKELVRVLDILAPYKALLTEYKSRTAGRYAAKTGTLNGVSSLAGYANSSECSDVRFAIIINDQVSNEVRFRAVDEIIRSIATSPPH